MVYICPEMEKLSSKNWFFAKIDKILVTEIYEPAQHHGHIAQI